MSFSKPIHALLFLLSIFSIKLSLCIQSSTNVCPEIEKHSLLSFKQSLKVPYNLLSSWDGEVDCCKWEGVVCNNSTGHVHELHLHGGLSGKINPGLLNLKHLTYLDLSHNDFFGETIPSFIGSFTNLEYLNLSLTGFEGKIPRNIGNLSNLNTLDLDASTMGLFVDSLEWLSGLSKLKYLNMNQVNLSRATNGAKVINSLPSLLELYLRFCSLDLMYPPNDFNLSTSLTVIDLAGNLMFSDQYSPIPSWLFQLNNVLSLQLSENNFIGSIPTVSSNASSIQYIDLSFNDLNSSIPDWLYFCKDLEYLDLSRNILSGKISDAIGNLSSLNTLDLHINHLSGKIPREITNLCRMQFLVLSSNELQGEVQDSFGNMSRCFLGSLESLELDGNLLSGEIPVSVGNFSSLEYLGLGDNKLTGNIPRSLGKLSNLKNLHIENNNLEGIVTESHFSNLSKLSVFSAAGNHLTLNVGTNWVPPIQLKALGLGSWNLGLGSQIPSWLQMQRNITQLDISNSRISGSIPAWFFYIEFLNASHNNLHGKIPHDINSSNEEWYNQYLFLSSNKLSGSLPRIGVGLLGLDLSYNLISEGLSHLLCHTAHETYRLEILRLEGNLLSGELPDCWKKWPNLKHLKLGNNTLSGSILNSIGFLVRLESLSLYGNKLSGKIPSTMHNCTSLLKIDLSNNNLGGNIPTWMGTSLVNLEILIMRSNKLSGQISSELCHLQHLQILDLSNNQIFGIIPRCVSNFTAMATKRLLNLDYLSVGLFMIVPISSWEAYIESASVMTKGAELEYSTILSLVTNIDLSSNNLTGEIPKELTSLVALGSLNLSGNHLTGLIPESIGDMKPLESLDLSRNSLSGQIPKGLTFLYSLSHLNLSLNRLSGSIPESTQLQSFNASSFIGNNLCGPPLSNCSCAGDEAPGQKKEEKEEEKSEIEWLYVFLALGFAVGFSAVCTALVLKKSWRYAYFKFLECMWDNIYVYFHIKWKRLRKPTSPASSS